MRLKPECPLFTEPRRPSRMIPRYRTLCTRGRRRPPPAPALLLRAGRSARPPTRPTLGRAATATVERRPLAQPVVERDAGQVAVEGARSGQRRRRGDRRGPQPRQAREGRRFEVGFGNAIGVVRAVEVPVLCNELRVAVTRWIEGRCMCGRVFTLARRLRVAKEA